MPRNLIKPTSKGQVTLPKKIRQKLEVSVNTFLDVYIEGEKIILQPVKFKNDTEYAIREYTDEQISEFLKEDKVSKENARFANKLLGTNKY